MFGGEPPQPPAGRNCNLNVESRSELTRVATAKQRAKYEQDLKMVPEMTALLPDFMPGGINEAHGAKFMRYFNIKKTRLAQ